MCGNWSWSLEEIVGVNEPITDVGIPIGTDYTTCSGMKTAHVYTQAVSDPKASSVNHMFTS